MSVCLFFISIENHTVQPTHTKFRIYILGKCVETLKKKPVFLEEKISSESLKCLITQ